MYNDYKSQLNTKAGQLRKEMTRQEKRLWYEFFNRYPIKIYRQRIIGGYIVDFYCSKARIGIEIDGSQHYWEENEDREKARSEYIKSKGIDILRITNVDVDKHFADVCEYIDKVIKDKLKSNIR